MATAKATSAPGNKKTATPGKRPVRAVADDGMLPKWWPVAVMIVLCGGAYLATMAFGKH